MSYRVRYTRQARDDLQRLYAFLLERDLDAAAKARGAIGKSIEFLQEFPFTCRKAVPGNPFLRQKSLHRHFSRDRATLPYWVQQDQNKQRKVRGYLRH